MIGERTTTHATAMRFLPRLFRKAIGQGTLTFSAPRFGPETYGGVGPGPDVAIRFTDASWDWKILLNPELRFAEAYMDGILVIEEGSVADLVNLFYVNKRRFDMSANQIAVNGVLRKLKRFQQHNPIARARANAEAHYNIGNDLYRLMLDSDMQYSCAYFPTGEETLEEAQLLKKRLIASKLRLEPGQRVLDIGCGWGGLALYLAKVADVEVVGVSLASEQLDLARARAKAEGLEHRVSFELQDYREIIGTFDRVVSVGMLEHVGAHHLQDYFLNVRDRLNPDGVALIHSIVTKAPPGITSAFIRKYIFPGGYSPAISEVFGAVERSGLWPLDAEVLRLHYALTLEHWSQRFAEHRDEARDLYDERFCRMWELYLAAAGGVFRYGSNAVLHLQLGRERDAVPVTRDYLGEAGAALAERESGI